MSERKVLNKYYPAEYDPSKIPKGKRNRNATFNIRIMAPFNMRCNMCKEYIYKGKKFNSRKEDVMDETYLGLRIFRFYIKCPRCVSEIAFKTDLENTDYTLEAGAKRLFEAEKIAQQMAEEERKAKEEDELNPMKLLENRTKASRAEMDQIDSLEELREMNTRKNLVNTDAMIEKYRKYEEMLAQLQMEKEEEEIREIFGDKGNERVKRLNDSDSDDNDDGPVKKKLAVTGDVGAKPTDILSETPNSSASSKPIESWQKSVGSLSNIQKLKGLVVKKKQTKSCPTVSGLSQPTSTTASNNDKPDTSDKLEENSTADANDDLNSKASDDNGKTNVSTVNSDKNSVDNNTYPSENSSEKLSLEKSTSETAKDSKESPSLSGDTVSTTKNSTQYSASVTTKSSLPTSSGLGLLGAYSDTDSDSDR
ncbi:hypothetical protein ACF0H5_007323 [Mactra antiquata]